MAEILTVAAITGGLDEAVRQEIVSAGTELSLACDQLLFRQGDAGDALYIILSGTLEIFIESPTGVRQTLARLTIGDCVGEMTLVTRRPRSASVIALEPTRLLKIPADACQRLMERHPVVRQRLTDFAARRFPSLQLALTNLFGGIEIEHLREFDLEANWVRLRGGDVLFRQGEISDSMFVVIHGSLEVFVEDAGKQSRVVDVLRRGASVGEMGLLANEPRSASVRAIRDAELIRIPARDFEILLEQNPQVGVHLARTLVSRLRRTTASFPVLPKARTIAVVPLDGEDFPKDFGYRLARALGAAADGASVRLLTSAEVEIDVGLGMSLVNYEDPANSRLLNWLNEQEDKHDYLVYECDPVASAWTKRCLRQSDLVLLVGLADSDSRLSELEIATATERATAGRKQELILLHKSAAVRPAETNLWLNARPLIKHHHLRLSETADFARLARSITGRSLGLVLSGGGARGFAHIGAIQAMLDCGLDIDLIGGTSMGSVISAQYALGLDKQQMIEINRRLFVECKVIGDLTFPFMSLMKAQSTVKLLKEMFGDVQIEDLWLNYFCVSCNLSRAEVVVHEAGPLWLWTRASCSVPGIGPPVSHHGDLLVDGGVLNNLPADVMRSRCEGAVFAVDVSPPVDLRVAQELPAAVSGWNHLWRNLNPFGEKQNMPNILQILSRTAVLSSVHNSEMMKQQVDLYLHPPTDEVNPLDWKGIERIVDIGYLYAHEKIVAWKRDAGSGSSIQRKIV